MSETSGTMLIRKREEPWTANVSLIKTQYFYIIV